MPKKSGGTLDLTPSWAEVLAYCLAIIDTSDDPEAIKICAQELLRMAQIADAFVELQKKGDPKVFIEVRGGVITNIQSTSDAPVIYVKDHDMKAEDDEDAVALGWQYWESKGGDAVVSTQEFQDAIAEANY